MFKVNNRDRERRHWRRSGVCIVNFEHISRHVLVFLFFNLDHVIARWEPTEIFRDNLVSQIRIDIKLFNTWCTLKGHTFTEKILNGKLSFFVQ